MQIPLLGTPVGMGTPRTEGQSCSDPSQLILSFGSRSCQVPADSKVKHKEIHNSVLSVVGLLVLLLHGGVVSILGAKI